MIFTRSWISQFIDISDKSLSEICATLNAVGIEVESSHALRAPDKVVVGFVKEKSKVENSDKLSLCKVDIGEKDLLQNRLRGEKCRRWAVCGCGACGRGFAKRH